MLRYSNNGGAPLQFFDSMCFDIRIVCKEVNYCYLRIIHQVRGYIISKSFQVIGSQCLTTRCSLYVVSSLEFSHESYKIVAINLHLRFVGGVIISYRDVIPRSFKYVAVLGQLSRRCLMFSNEYVHEKQRGFGFRPGFHITSLSGKAVNFYCFDTQIGVLLNCSSLKLNF